MKSAIVESLPWGDTHTHTHKSSFDNINVLFTTRGSINFNLHQFSIYVNSLSTPHITYKVGVVWLKITLENL